MSWTTKVMYMVLFMTVSGTLVTWIWCWLGRWLEKIGFLHISYKLMKIVMIFWLVPISYVILNIWDDVTGRWGGFLMIGTPILYRISMVFSAGWMIGALWFVFKYILELYSIFQLRKSAIPCENRVNQIFLQEVRNMGITKRVTLKRSYSVMAPQLTGCIHPIVLLPVKEYTPKELEVIFAHELTHIKHGDILLKNLAMIIRVIHFMNPAAWRFYKMLDKWGEFACDYEVCAGKMYIGQYYEVIADMAQKLSDYRFMVSCLVEDAGKLRERMEHVMISYKMKSRSGALAAALVAVIVWISGSTVYAASVKSADVLQYVNEKTAVEIEVEKNPELQEYVELTLDPDVIETEGEVNVSARSGTTDFKWVVVKNGATKSPEFYAGSGKYINVTVSNPSGKSIRAGIINPDDSRTYVNGTYSVAHDFKISTSGNYRVYVQNVGSDTSITVTGSYFVH